MLARAKAQKPRNSGPAFSALAFRSTIITTNFQSVESRKVHGVEVLTAYDQFANRFAERQQVLRSAGVIENRLILVDAEMLVDCRPQIIGR